MRSGAAAQRDGGTPLSDTSLQREVKKLKEADKDGTQTIIVSGFVDFFCRFECRTPGQPNPFRLLFCMFFGEFDHMNCLFFL